MCSKANQVLYKQMQREALNALVFIVAMNRALCLALL